MYIFATKWLKAISPFVLMPLYCMDVGKFWRKAALSPSEHWAVRRMEVQTKAKKGKMEPDLEGRLGRSTGVNWEGKTCFDWRKILFAILHLLPQKSGTMLDRGKAVPLLCSKNRTKLDHYWISLTFYLLQITTLKRQNKDTFCELYLA